MNNKFIGLCLGEAESSTFGDYLIAKGFDEDDVYSEFYEEEGFIFRFENGDFTWFSKDIFVGSCHSADGFKKKIVDKMGNIITGITDFLSNEQHEEM